MSASTVLVAVVNFFCCKSLQIVVLFPAGQAVLFKAEEEGGGEGEEGSRETC